MAGRQIGWRRGRRGLLRLAALGLGGAAIACGRIGDQPKSANRQAQVGGRSTPELSPPATESAGTPPAGPRGPATPGAVVTGDPQCLVTKQRGLSASYAPSDLTTLPARLLASDGVQVRRVAADAVVRLIDDAAREGHGLFVLSGFRSYQEQERVMRDEVALYGKALAERQVAPPGHSEHQLGLAVDITSRRAPYELRAAFGQEPEGRWLATNAPRYGFVISYPQGKEQVTGYTYEPWHIRHLGQALAEQVAASGLTLTEFLPKHNLAGGCP